MSHYLQCLETLRTLEAGRTQLCNAGEVLVDCWIAQSKPGGTARTENVYWQLRSRQPIFDGKKSKYLKADEVARYEAAIARGKKIKAIDRQIALLQKKISRVEAILARK